MLQEIFLQGLVEQLIVGTVRAYRVLEGLVGSEMIKVIDLDMDQLIRPNFIYFNRIDVPINFKDIIRPRISQETIDGRAAFYREYEAQVQQINDNDELEARLQQNVCDISNRVDGVKTEDNAKDFGDLTKALVELQQYVEKGLFKDWEIRVDVKGFYEAAQKMRRVVQSYVHELGENISEDDRKLFSDLERSLRYVIDSSKWGIKTQEFGTLGKIVSDVKRSVTGQGLDDKIGVLPRDVYTGKLRPGVLAEAMFKRPYHDKLKELLLPEERVAEEEAESIYERAPGLQEGVRADEGRGPVRIREPLRIPSGAIPSGNLRQALFELYDSFDLLPGTESAHFAVVDTERVLLDTSHDPRTALTLLYLFGNCMNSGNLETKPNVFDASLNVEDLLRPYDPSMMPQVLGIVQSVCNKKQRSLYSIPLYVKNEIVASA